MESEIMEQLTENQNMVLELPVDEIVTLGTICRLCANQNEKVIGIYSEEGISNDLATKMNTYLPVKVSENDILPLQCCWGCASTVLAWHELVLASVEADRRLREFQIIPPEKPTVYDECEQDVVASAGNKDAEEFNVLHIPEPTEVKKKRRKSKSSRSCKTFTHDDANFTSESQNSDDDADLKFEFDDDISVKSETVPENGLKKDLSNENEWISKDRLEKVEEFNFACEYCSAVCTLEEEIINHVKAKHPDKADILNNYDPNGQPSSGKKERRKTTKIDQDAVNAAKVIVEGRVYYNCKTCGKSLHSPYTYIWHMRIHTGERPFVCDLCGKQFRVSQGLVRHLRETHEGIKNFPCDLCGRMFATRRNVVEHRRIHTNERPYICDLCGKTFKQKASLFVHNRSHTNSFPFQCSYCARGFRTKPPLMIHITRHTGEKPYPCDVCGRCFRIKYELKRHRLIHSDEKPFVCNDCGLSFRQKRYLRNHNKVNHNRATP